MSERTAFIARMATRINTGHAGAGPIVWDGGEDISHLVQAACDRTGLRPTSSRSLDRDYDWTATAPRSLRATSGETQQTRPVAGYLTAYAARWNVVKKSSADPDGTPFGRTAYTPDAFDEWLNTAQAGAIVVMRNHADEVIGRLVEADADETGLLVTAEISDVPEGRRAMADARSGKLRAFSSWAMHSEADATLERDSEGEYLLIHRATLYECGPQDAPGDPGARIVAVDGEPLAARSADLDGVSVADVFAELEAVTGKTRDRLMLDASIDRHARRRIVDERVASIDRALAAHKRAWKRHADAVRERALGLRYAPSFDEIGALADEVDEPAEWLRLQLTGDLYRSLVPPKVDLTRALLDGAAERARRRR